MDTRSACLVVQGYDEGWMALVKTRAEELLQMVAATGVEARSVDVPAHRARFLTTGAHGRKEMESRGVVAHADAVVVCTGNVGPTRIEVRWGDLADAVVGVQALVNPMDPRLDHDEETVAHEVARCCGPCRLGRGGQDLSVSCACR